jgi:hypothetical protein
VLMAAPACCTTPERLLPHLASSRAPRLRRWSRSGRSTARRRTGAPLTAAGSRFGRKGWSCTTRRNYGGPATGSKGISASRHSALPPARPPKRRSCSCWCSARRRARPRIGRRRTRCGTDCASAEWSSTMRQGCGRCDDEMCMAMPAPLRPVPPPPTHYHHRLRIATRTFPLWLCARLMDGWVSVSVVCRALAARTRGARSG